MGDIVNTATIKVVADGSGVEAGLRPIDDATARTGKNLENLGATAQKTSKTIEGMGRGPGLSGVGEGADTAATRVDRATKSMADSIQRAIQSQAALAAGAKGTAENFAALAQVRGVNTDALKPLLAQLDEAKRKADLAADAQRRLDESTKFLNDLKSRADGLGKTASQLAEIRAAELGVSDAAGPMIAKMREAEQAGQGSFGKLGDMASKLKTVVLGLAASAAAAGAAFAAVINSSINGLAELDDMTQKTGASVESLSKIQKVVTVYGPDMSAVDGALSKLAKGMATVDDETNKVQKALGALGLSSKDASGKLRDPAEVLVDVSKKLQNYNDGAAKTALITDLIGKSGAELMPFLNDLAENYDKMSSVSADAAGSAASFQDQLGWMKLRVKELFTTITIDALPALNDLAGAFLDVYNGQKDLGKPDTKKWADEIALAIAQAADGAAALGRGIAVIWNSLKAVKADISLASSFAINANPLVVGYKVATGGSPSADLKKATAERNKIVEDANKTLMELLDKPLPEFEKAFTARLAARGKEASTPAGDEERKKDLLYSTGNDPAIKAAEAAAKKEESAYAGVVAAIQTKIAENRLEIAVGQEASESQKLQIKVDQELAAGKLKLSDSHREIVQAKLAELAASEQLVKVQQAEKDGMAWMQQSAQVRNLAIASLATQYELYGKTTDAREMAMVSIKAEADIEKFLNDERRKGIDISQELEAQLRAEKDMRVEVDQATLGQIKALGYASQLDDLNKLSGLETIADYQSYAAAKLAIDAETWQERIRLAGDGTEAQKILQKSFDAWYADQQGASDPFKKMQLSLARYGRDATDIGAQIGSALTSAFDGAANAFANFATTGKLSFRDLATSIISDLVRIQAKAAIGGLAQSFLGAIGTDTTGGWGASLMKSFGISGARAAGGPVASGQSYLVGERGPEIFTPSNSGSITPNHLIGSGGGGGAVNINLVTNVSDGGSSSQTSGASSSNARAAADALNAKMKSIIAQETRQGGSIWKLWQGRG